MKMNNPRLVMLRLGEASISATACRHTIGCFAKPQHDKHEFICRLCEEYSSALACHHATGCFASLNMTNRVFICRAAEESNRATACVDPAGFFAKPQKDKQVDWSLSRNTQRLGVGPPIRMTIRGIAFSHSLSRS